MLYFLYFSYMCKRSYIVTKYCIIALYLIFVLFLYTYTSTNSRKHDIIRKEFQTFHRHLKNTHNQGTWHASSFDISSVFTNIPITETQKTFNSTHTIKLVGLLLPLHYFIYEDRIVNNCEEQPRTHRFHQPYPWTASKSFEKHVGSDT